MTPQQRQTLLEYYCAHPDLVGLYSMLDNTLVDAAGRAAAAGNSSCSTDAAFTASLAAQTAGELSAGMQMTVWLCRKSGSRWLHTQLWAALRARGLHAQAVGKLRVMAMIPLCARWSGAHLYVLSAVGGCVVRARV